MGEIDGAKTNRHGEAPNRDDPWQIGHLPNAGDAFYRCRGVIPALGSKGRRSDGISAAMGEDGGDGCCHGRRVVPRHRPMFFMSYCT